MLQYFSPQWIIVIIIIIKNESHSNIIVERESESESHSSKVIWQTWCQLQEHANSSVFTQRRKMSSDSEDCTAVGKPFHTQAADELNARPPMVTCLVQRTLYLADDDKRRHC